MIETIKQRIEKLRTEMRRINAQAFYFTGSDCHHNEYLPPRYQTIAYFSGFTGSAARLIITEKNAALWTDSRYFIQAEEQLQNTGIDLQRMGEKDCEPPEIWIQNRLEKAQIAVDLWSLSVNEYKLFKQAFELNEQTPRFRISNGIDCLNAVWDERPKLPANPITNHADSFQGTSTKEKLEQLRQHLSNNKNIDGVFLTALDEIAWLFNLRGSDIAYNPLFFAYAIITQEKTKLWVGENTLSESTKKALKEEKVELLNYADACQIGLGNLTLEADPESTSVVFDHPTLYRIVVNTNRPYEKKVAENCLESRFLLHYAPSEVKRMKAQKSIKEINALRKTMKRDSVAMVKFLYWVHCRQKQNAPLEEYDVVKQLHHFRSLQENFVGESFPSIVGFNANGAIVHRTTAAENSQPITGDGLLLLDSGAHYLDGTTDITRTLCIGKASPQKRRDFTLVLKGMIGLSQTKFPEGTTGTNLDILARQHLWQQGLDYGHGTGHGIGFFLPVHEGPQSIRRQQNSTPITPGMVLSNEPGLYRTGEYGIRIENTLLCVPAEETPFGTFFAFETLNLCPIDIRLVEKSMLEKDEIDWLDAYHHRCYEELKDYLKPEEADYLQRMCRPC